jgi:predicted metal-dependent HD superfamily phosphohydrolase
VNEVARLIRLTAGYALPTWQQAGPEDANAHVLLDADLAGLSISAAEFDHYADHIRREFAAVPEEQFRTGRLSFLQRLLEREYIYYTPQMLACCEAAARENIQREMARMR